MQSFSRAALYFSLGMTVSDRSEPMVVQVNYFEESSGAPVVSGTAKLSRGCIADSSALRKTLQCHAIPSILAANLIVVGYVIVDHNFTSSLSY